MEKREIDQIVYLKMEYEMAFKNGYQEVIYSDTPELLTEPEVDYSNMFSIGYYDGFNYGDYCLRTGLRYEVKPENLIANIDKSFTQALNRYNSLGNESKGAK